jgi:hypothetical protein
LNPITYAVREIRRRKYRTAVNIVGFVIAISTLITLVIAARGWETCTTVPLNRIGTDIILFYTAPIVPSGLGFSASATGVAVKLADEYEKKCSKCKKSLPEGKIAFCPYCGSSLS